MTSSCVLCLWFSVCHHGQWSCKSLPSPATCAVEEGSHVTTFDGKAFTFHGDCYYPLAKVESKVTDNYTVPFWRDNLDEKWMTFYMSQRFLIIFVFVFPSLFQNEASPKFTVLVQLVPCIRQKFDTCLKSVVVLLNNDRNNVSISFIKRRRFDTYTWTCTLYTISVYLQSGPN
jgi:hypothetical protein